MKKLILLIVVSTSIAACKKSDSGGADLPLDTFTFGGTSFKATEYKGSNYYYWGTGYGGPAQIYLVFNKTNMVEGNFNIVGLYDTTSDAVRIQLDYKPTGAVYYTSYLATRFSNKQLSITMDGGYRVFSFPKVWAKASATDSVEISGYLKEYL